MKIVKLENGNVVITDESGNIEEVISGGCCVSLSLACQGTVVQIYVAGKYINIPVDEVTGTTVEPDPEVPFSGTAQDLIDLLSTDFFFELAGGIDAQYYTGNYHTFLTAVASATSYNNAIGTNLLLGFPIYVGADCTFEQLKVKVTGGAVGNSVWGLYECENGLPADLIFQTTPVNNNVAAASIYTIPTPIQIKKGFYYVGYNSSSQPSLSCAPATVVPAVIGGDISDVPSPLLGRAFVYTGTLPATWGTPTNFYTANSVQFVPLVQFKISI
jgi:hypothetical protein